MLKTLLEFERYMYHSMHYFIPVFVIGAALFMIIMLAKAGKH